MRFLVLSILLSFPIAAQPALATWLQWGGPHRDFQIDTKLPAWPDGGPKILWHRPLGEGYSGILAEEGVLYTMYRTGSTEHVIAASAGTGKTIWEHSYNAPFRSDLPERGNGPHATPSIAGDRLFTAGAT